MTGSTMPSPVRQADERGCDEMPGMSTSTAASRSERFAQLHAHGCLVVPNPWDAGSARLLEIMGFEALASTGAGLAFSQGRADLATPLTDKLAYLQALCHATGLPVTADLEDCGPTHDHIAHTIACAVQAGVAGVSIEDTTGERSRPIRDKLEAAERVQVAAQAAKAGPHRVMLTARADNYFYGIQNLGDTIERLQAYQEAGADVLFAPGLRTREDIRAVLSSVDRPVNVLMGFPGVDITLDELRDMGVRRVSVGGVLARVAYSAMMRAAQGILQRGSFDCAGGAIAGPLLNRLFGDERLGRAERQQLLAEQFLEKRP
jgi:2-methylisocitrate lyase-like PEP mutase family enzyme